MTIRIPDNFMGKPIKGAMERVLDKQSSQSEQTESRAEVSSKNVDGFIYVPSIKLYVAKERSHLNKNWFDAQKLLHAQGDKMPTIPEFIAFLKYLQTNQANPEYKNIFEDITAVRSPWRAEWLDADFKVVNSVLRINYEHETKGKKLEPKYSEPLDRCLMQDKTPGIDLTDWINRATKQGLPSIDVTQGNLRYYFPRSDNNSVAGFGADSGRAGLSCGRGPTVTLASLGVRLVGAKIFLEV